MDDKQPAETQSQKAYAAFHLRGFGQNLQRKVLATESGNIKVDSVVIIHCCPLNPCTFGASIYLPKLCNPLTTIKSTHISINWLKCETNLNLNSTAKFFLGFWVFWCNGSRQSNNGNSSITWEFMWRSIYF